ncbi:Hypothetical predicted protein [Olea europaea subsp. europaea]|uniref:Uncharacterized protein n=1 Tax=Olea europaea subsp. europaea TaxID=158383 RepID=A0A8S0TNJ6_OLEEU|nr:Hypothetical predicted protein [Olea europaea subsp. europaea]
MRARPGGGKKTARRAAAARATFGDRNANSRSADTSRRAVVVVLAQPGADKQMNRLLFGRAVRACWRKSAADLLARRPPPVRVCLFLSLASLWGGPALGSRLGAIRATSTPNDNARGQLAQRQNAERCRAQLRFRRDDCATHCVCCAPSSSAPELELELELEGGPRGFPLFARRFLPPACEGSSWLCVACCQACFRAPNSRASERPEDANTRRGPRRRLKLMSACALRAPPSFTLFSAWACPIGRVKFSMATALLGSALLCSTRLDSTRLETRESTRDQLARLAGADYDARELISRGQPLRGSLAFCVRLASSCATLVSQFDIFAREHKPGARPPNKLAAESQTRAAGKFGRTTRPGGHISPIRRAARILSRRRRRHRRRGAERAQGAPLRVALVSRGGGQRTRRPAQLNYGPLGPAAQSYQRTARPPDLRSTGRSTRRAHSRDSGPHAHNADAPPRPVWPR